MLMMLCQLGGAADAQNAGPAGAFRQYVGQLMLMMQMRGAVDAHDAGPAGALRQHARQLMFMMLGQLTLLGNTRRS